MDNKKAILIVDDELEFLKMIRFRLEASNYEVVTATTGREALDKVKSYKVDAVLLDILLPDMDGINVLKEIRKIRKNMPVFIITAFSNEERFKLANKFNASGFIVKTDDLKSEVEHITSVLRLSDQFKG